MRPLSLVFAVLKLRNLEAPQMHILPYKRVHAHTHKHTHTRTDNKIEGTEPEEQRMRPVGGDLGRVGGETRALPAALVG